MRGGPAKPVRAATCTRSAAWSWTASRATASAFDSPVTGAGRLGSMTATRVLPSAVQASSGRSWSGLIVLMFGAFMFVLDFFIVNVALPSIQQGLGASEGAIEWVVAGYTLSTAV